MGGRGGRALLTGEIFLFWRKLESGTRQYCLDRVEPPPVLAPLLPRGASCSSARWRGSDPVSPTLAGWAPATALETATIAATSRQRDAGRYSLAGENKRLCLLSLPGGARVAVETALPRRRGECRGRQRRRLRLRMGRRSGRGLVGGGGRALYGTDGRRGRARGGCDGGIGF